MQFGFIPNRSTTDAIYFLCQLQEQFLRKKKKSYFTFVDQEKEKMPLTEFHVVSSAGPCGKQMFQNIPEWLIKTVQTVGYEPVFIHHLDRGAHTLTKDWIPLGAISYRLSSTNSKYPR